MSYAELICRSCFSLLHGASHPEELIERAHEAGLEALAITDRDAVYGLVQAHRRAEELGLKLICGATVTVGGHGTVALLAETPEGWGAMCRLLTAARTQDDKGFSSATLQQVAGLGGRGVTAILMPGWSVVDGRVLADAFGDHLEVAWTRSLAPSDAWAESWALELSEALHRPLLATNDVLYHEPDRARLADVLTCIRLGTTLDEAGTALQPNDQRYLLEPETFQARYGRWPEAITRTVEVADRCHFTLDALAYRYPREVVPEGYTAMRWLRQLVSDGAAGRYPEGVPEPVQAQIDRELDIIEQLDFPSYFLTVHDVVAFARRRGILCQGRGSAANSAVCYVLGITAVNPARSSLLFERFISAERGEPPDIDVDFEHERREEVLQYVYERYGRQRAAMVNEIIAYRSRSAVRDVGKVFGMSVEQVDRLAKAIGHHGPSLYSDLEETLTAHGIDPSSQQVRWTLEMARELRGFPRHLSIHVGGFVIAEQDVVELVPVEPATMPGRTVIQWDKYGVEALGFVKVDLLALGMLTAIRKAFDLIEGFSGERFTLYNLPAEDPAVYRMFQAADTIGVFQIESRAQQSMLPRLKPACFYDLVIEVAIVRPGPIQGGMVHPYLRRRMGEEPVTYAHPSLEPILERTLGVPLFQEQVMQMAVAVGGFTAGEADALRRAMGAWRKRGTLGPLAGKLVEGMKARGIPEAYAEAILQQIKGFGEYGFPESHAASFALLVYASGWLKCHHPAAFCAALINAQPMGFYAPRTLVADAQRHGVEVRPVDILASQWDCTLEPGSGGAPALRLGIRLIRGLSREQVDRVLRAREERPFRDLIDLAHRSGADRTTLEKLAESGAFRALEADPRRAVWTLQGMWTDLPLFAAVSRAEPELAVDALDPMTALQGAYRTVGLSVADHAAAAVRRRLELRGVQSTLLGDLGDLPDGQKVRLVGLVSSRQRPGTAKGVVFLGLEDETALVNVVVWPSRWIQHRPVIMGASILAVEGVLQRQGGALSVVLEEVWRPDDEGTWPSQARNFR